MTLTTLRNRAAKKRAVIERDGDTYTLIDTQTEEVLVETVVWFVLEDKVAWLDAVE